MKIKGCKGISTTILLALMMVLLLFGCGKTARPKGVYRSYIDLQTMGWFDLEASYEFNGDTVIETDLNGIKVKGTITYNGDIIHIEFEDGTHGDYIYDAENDMLIAQLVGDLTGRAVLAKEMPKGK